MAYSTNGKFCGSWVLHARELRITGDDSAAQSTDAAQDGKVANKSRRKKRFFTDYWVSKLSLQT
jgi:hypothetical protein